MKQHLAALRMLFDWLVVDQVLHFNPASSVRDPKHVVKAGKIPVLSGKRQLVRWTKSAPLVNAFGVWLDEQRSRVSRTSCATSRSNGPAVLLALAREFVLKL